MKNSLSCLYSFIEYEAILCVIKNLNNKEKVRDVLEKHFKKTIITNNITGKAFDLINHIRYFILNSPNSCKIERTCNIYKFTGKNQLINQLVLSNKPVSRLDKNNLQFIMTEKNLKIMRGNIFYAEIELLEKCHRQSWDNECVSFGLCFKGCSPFKQVGWEKGTIGIHIDDGGIFKGSMNPIHSYGKIEKNNTIGVGIIQKKYFYYIFFTVNGIKIWNDTLYSSNDLYLGMGLDNSFPVKLNIGKEPFKFDLIRNYSMELWD